MKHINWREYGDDDWVCLFNRTFRHTTPEGAMIDVWSHSGQHWFMEVRADEKRRVYRGPYDTCTGAMIDGERAAFEYTYNGDYESGDASRITPDPAGEDMAADDGRTVDALRAAHAYRAVMARLYGTYSAKAQRAAAVFESLFAVRNVMFA